MLDLLYNYIEEKNLFDNLLLEKLTILSKLSQAKFTKKEISIKTQEKIKISYTDQINFIIPLEFGKIEDNDFIKIYSLFYMK